MKNSTQDLQVVKTSKPADVSGKEKSLAKQTGFFKKLHAKMAGSRVNFEGLKRITLAKTEGETQMALTGLHLVASETITANIAKAMPQFVSLTKQLNSNTVALHQAITNGVIAEAATHLNNRDANKKLFDELKNESKISLEEQEILNRIAETDAQGDIARSKARAKAAGNVVGTLHSRVLKGIVSRPEILRYKDCHLPKNRKT
jgi:hypothetical protein